MDENYKKIEDIILDIATTFGSKNGYPPMKIKIKLLGQKLMGNKWYGIDITLLNGETGNIPIGIGDNWIEEFEYIIPELETKINKILNPKIVNAISDSLRTNLNIYGGIKNENS